MASLCINLKELLYAGYGTVEMQDSTRAKLTNLARTVLLVFHNKAVIPASAHRASKERTVTKMSTSALRVLVSMEVHVRINPEVTAASVNKALPGDIARRYLTDA